MKTLELNDGKTCLVDDEDFERLSKYIWGHLWCRGRKAYYVRRRTKWKDTILMHREVLGITDKNVFVDHINGDPSDNRKSNLRVATNSQNLANIKKPKHNKSGFKGVSFDKERNKWAYLLTVNGKKYRGRANTAEEAAKAYDELVKKYIPEFGNLNFKDAA
jgi:hypothetical protein